MMTEIAAFVFGALFGALAVITWALCAADKRKDDEDDTSDR